MNERDETWTFFNRVDLNELVNESFDADFLSIHLFTVIAYMAKFMWFYGVPLGSLLHDPASC